MATRAATRSATSRGPCRWPCRRCAVWDSDVWTASAATTPARWRLRPDGGDIAGKDSVTGHWEMAGIVLERPFPTFPDGFPPGARWPVRARASGDARSAMSWRPGQPSSSARGRAHADRRANRLHVGRQRVPDAAHEDVIPIDEQYRICQERSTSYARGLGVARVIARPFVGRARRVHANGQPPGLRASSRPV